MDLRQYENQSTPLEKLDVRATSSKMGVSLGIKVRNYSTRLTTIIIRPLH